MFLLIYAILRRAALIQSATMVNVHVCLNITATHTLDAGLSVPLALTAKETKYAQSKSASIHAQILAVATQFVKLLTTYQCVLALQDTLEIPLCLVMFSKVPITLL